MKKAILTIMVLVLFVSFAFAGCVKRPAEQGDASVPTEAAAATEALPAVTEKTEATEAAAATEAPEITEAPAPIQKADDKFYVLDRSANAMNFASTIMFETDNGVYYLCSFRGMSAFGRTQVVYYSDKEYRDWIPLCGKPDCLHKESGCNAILEGEAYEIWLYGDHIYYFFSGEVNYEQGQGAMLWRMNLDGSDHEKVADIDPRKDYDDVRGITDWTASFHGGYLMLCGRRPVYDGSGGMPGMEFYNFIVDLEDPKAVPQRMDILIDGSYTLNNYIVIECSGNDIILTRGDEDGRHYYRCDLETMTGTELCVLPNEIGLNAVHLYDGKLWFTSGYDLGKIFAVDIETGEVETVASAEPKTTLWYRACDGYIVGADFGEGVLNGTGIYDMNGELLEFIDISEYGLDLLIECVIGHTVYGFEYTGSNFMEVNCPAAYLDLDELGTEKFGWHKWEP